MDKLMQAVAHAVHGKSCSTYQHSCNSVGIPAIDYDNEQDKVMKWQNENNTHTFWKSDFRLCGHFPGLQAGSEL